MNFWYALYIQIDHEESENHGFEALESILKAPGPKKNHEKGQKFGIQNQNFVISYYVYPNSTTTIPKLDTLSLKDTKDSRKSQNFKFLFLMIFYYSYTESTTGNQNQGPEALGSFHKALRLKNFENGQN